MRILAVQPGASYSTADVYVGMVKALERQGHEIVKYALDSRIDFSGRYLNQAWKRAKHTQPSLLPPTPADILYLAGQGVLERSLRHEVDCVLIFSAMYLHPDILVMLKRAGQRIGVVLTESPYDDLMQSRILSDVDIAWTNERSSVNFLRAFNSEVFYLPPAYDPERHYPAESSPDVPAHDVVFVGSGFSERIDLLSAVNWDGIDLGLYGTWDLLGSRNKLRQYLRDSIIPNETSVDLYRRAAIGLNLYRTSIGFGRDAPHITYAESLNPRAVELAACGVFTISDYRMEVDETFGSAVPTFQDAAQLETLIRHYLTRPALRESMAARYRDALADWTFEARARQIISDITQVALVTA